MKKLFTIIALFISMSTYAQNYWAFGSIYKASETQFINSTKLTKASPGDSLVIFYDFVNLTPADTSALNYIFFIYDGASKTKKILSKYSFNYLNTHDRLFFVVPSDFPLTMSGELNQSGGGFSTASGRTSSYISIVANTSGVISFEEIKNKDIKVEIYSIRGEFVKSGNSKDIKSGLASGVYLFTSEKEMLTGKFLVD